MNAVQYNAIGIELEIQLSYDVSINDCRLLGIPNRVITLDANLELKISDNCQTQ